MPGTPALAVAIVGATGLTVTTASFTPTAGDLLIAFPVSRGTGASMPTIADSLGETWTPFDAGSPMTACKSRLFWKLATANAQTVTVTTTGGTQTAIAVVKVSGAGTDFSNFKVNSHATTTTRAVTMDAFTATGGCIYFISASSGGSWAIPTGYTEVSDVLPATNLRIVWGYDMTSPATTISSLGAGVNSTMFGIELRDPGTSITVGGQLLSMSVGTVTVTGEAVDVDVDVTGQAATMSVGNVTVATGTSFEVSGQEMTVAVGDVVYSEIASVEVSGQELTTATAAGDVEIISVSFVDVTGQSFTVEVGEATVALPGGAHVSGNEMTASVGQITFGGATGANATTNLLTTSVGDVTVVGKANVNLTTNGQQLTTSVGTIPSVVGKANATVTAITGMTAGVGTISTVRQGVGATVTGQQMTASVGDATVNFEVEVAVTGLQMTMSVGAVFVSLGGLEPEDRPDREGMMIVMTHWMGN